MADVGELRILAAMRPVAEPIIALTDHVPLIWYVQVNGLIVDARALPLPIQARAFELGAIPYIPRSDATARPRCSRQPYIHDA